jgi:hypothetical protein
MKTFVVIFHKENLVHLDVVVQILIGYVLVDVAVLHQNQLLNDVVVKEIFVE